MSKGETNQNAPQTEHLNLKVKSQVYPICFRMVKKFSSKLSPLLNWKNSWTLTAKGRVFLPTMLGSFSMENVSTRPKHQSSWTWRMVMKSMCLLNKLVAIDDFLKLSTLSYVLLTSIISKNHVLYKYIELCENEQVNI